MALPEPESSVDKYEVLEIIGKMQQPSVKVNAYDAQGRGAFATARKVRRRSDAMVRPI
jgi:hypothetical protein